MKKVFWGVLLAMAGLTSVVLTALNLGLILMNAAMPATVWTVCSILAGLGQAAGYYLLWKGAESLPQTQSWHYVGLFSKILCAYTVAITVFNQLPLTLPAAVSTILYYVTDLGSFMTMYFCVLGMGELERVRRKNLFARQISQCFTVWVVVRLLASLLTGYLYIVAVGGYVVMLVFLGRAARAYEKRDDFPQF